MILIKGQINSYPAVRLVWSDLEELMSQLVNLSVTLEDVIPT
jgi:hypothetical protein